MKSYRYFLTLAAFLLMAASVSVSHVYASSHNKGKHQSAGGHGPFTMHFADMDADGNGSLSFDEFKKVFPSTEQKGFDQLDNNQDGTLSHDEWHQFKEMHKGMGTHHKQKYHSKKLSDPSKFNAHFPDMDSDNNDRVTFEEFKSYFTEASDHEAVFNAIDLDGKGDIDHDEWHEFKAAHGLKHID